MIELKEFQRKAVDNLFDTIKDCFQYERHRQKIILKAPTGSGKTIIAFSLLAKLTNELPNNIDNLPEQCAYIWIAPNELHEQSYWKMKSFFEENKILRPIRFNEIDQTKGSLSHGEILFVNWQSINSEDNIYMRDSEQGRNLKEIAYNTQNNANIPIIAIIDEEHLFSGRNATQSEKALSSINPFLELRISATPTTSGDELINIKRQDVIKEEMIKKHVILNPSLTDDNSGLTINQQLLKQALIKRDDLQQRYEKLGVNINPLLLIQLPNDSKSNSTEDNTILQELEEFLNIRYNITTTNHRLAVWLANRKDNVEGIETNNGITEVLLFKQAIALGWDCPRAAVLLIFRELQSTTFTIQTVGRILRMPEQRFYSDEMLNQGYIYTNLSSDIIEIVRDDMDYLSRFVAKRKEDLNNITLTSEYVNRKIVRNRLSSKFKQILVETIKEHWDLQELTLFTSEGDVHRENVLQQNITNSTLNMNVESLFVTIPKDLKIQNDDEQTINVDSKTQMARNNKDISRMFSRFCADNVGSFAKKDSSLVLAAALEYFMLRYFDMDSPSTRKIILNDENKRQFIPLIERSLIKYQKYLDDKQTQVSIEENTWQIPIERWYNEENYMKEIADIHAMQPFFKQIRESSPEEKFRKFLQDHKDSIEWWYKNADSGKENFSIAYKNTQGKDAAFYVDFVIKKRSGEICLFDTKTPQSDINASNKHNALLDYIKKEQKESSMNIIGGVIIQDNNNLWRYCSDYIKDTEDISSWQYFEL